MIDDIESLLFLRFLLLVEMEQGEERHQIFVVDPELGLPRFW